MTVIRRSFDLDPGIGYSGVSYYAEIKKNFKKKLFTIVITGLKILMEGS